MHQFPLQQEELKLELRQDFQLCLLNQKGDKEKEGQHRLREKSPKCILIETWVLR